MHPDTIANPPPNTTNEPTFQGNSLNDEPYKGNFDILDLVIFLRSLPDKVHQLLFHYILDAQQYFVVIVAVSSKMGDFGF